MSQSEQHNQHLAITFHVLLTDSRSKESRQNHNVRVDQVKPNVYDQKLKRKNQTNVSKSRSFCGLTFG